MGQDFSRGLDGFLLGSRREHRIAHGLIDLTSNELEKGFHRKNEGRLLPQVIISLLF